MKCVSSGSSRNCDCCVFVCVFVDVCRLLLLYLCGVNAGPHKFKPLPRLDFGVRVRVKHLLVMVKVRARSWGMHYVNYRSPQR